jgi:hypothetical protein
MQVLGFPFLSLPGVLRKGLALFIAEKRSEKRKLKTKLKTKRKKSELCAPQVKKLVVFEIA